MRKRMASAALARAQREFNVTTMAERMLALYQDVLKTKKP
jgi:hypothetical protein